MRTRRPSSQQDIVSRRLAHLSEQLALVPDGDVDADADAGAAAPDEIAAPAAVGGEWWAEHTRVAAPRPALRVVAPAPPPTTEPEPLPDPPGRHAARRRVSWADAVPDTLRGRVHLGPGPLAIVAVLVATALTYTCWQVVRADPDRPVPVAAVTSDGGTPRPLVGETPTDALSTTAPAPGVAASTSVTVDVAGKVRRPGIVVLAPGARVVDAVDEAGGARPGVDLTSLNLARLLVDGEQIVVGVAGAAAPAVPPVAPGASTGDSSTAPGALVDLNLATQPELESLPGIGPVTALAIITWREEHGGFSAVNELLEVSGIGDVTLAQLTPLVTV